MSMNRRGFLQVLGASSLALAAPQAFAQILGDGPPIHIDERGDPIEVDAVLKIKALEAARWRAMVEHHQLFKEGWPRLMQMLERASGFHEGVVVTGTDPDFAVGLAWVSSMPETVSTAAPDHPRFKGYRKVVDDRVIRAYLEMQEQGMRLASRWSSREKELEYALQSAALEMPLEPGKIRFLINGRDYYMAKHFENPYLIREFWPEYCAQEVCFT